MSKAVTAVLSIALVFGLAACRQEQPAAATDTAPAPLATSDTATATHPASPGGTALVPDVAAGTTVLVVVNEGSIAAKGQTVPPGPAVITVENGGKEVHNLYIEGEGISRAAGDNLEPGKAASIDVILRPGSYQLYCPILDHRTKGESTQLTVGTDATATTSS